MTVVVAEFLAPRGLIEPGLFPLDSGPALAERLNEYLTQGQQNVAGLGLSAAQQDEAVTAYVYYRSYDAVVDRLAITPSTVSFADQGSVSFSSAQMGTFATKRDKFLDDYTAILASAGRVESGESHDSVTIRVVPTW